MTELAVFTLKTLILSCAKVKEAQIPIETKIGKLLPGSTEN